MQPILARGTRSHPRLRQFTYFPAPDSPLSSALLQRSPKTSVIRSSKTRRRLAWLGILAMALIAFAPTISRLRSLSANDHSVHAHHMGMTHAHDGAGDPSPDDCWSKCGYCDFLAHAPAIDSVDYVAPALAFGNTHLAGSEPAIAAAPATFVQAAQPRGPPAVA